jgi:hypothetical protein
MSDRSGTSFPRRDAEGRIVAARDLLAMTLAGAVAGAAALLVFDGLFALLGLGTFGDVNGWLAVILPTMLLVEDFRAWRDERVRILVAVVGAALGIGAGLLAAGLAGDLPSLASGSVGAVVFTATYALIWFYGVRVLSGRMDEAG